MPIYKTKQPFVLEVERGWAPKVRGCACCRNDLSKDWKKVAPLVSYLARRKTVEYEGDGKVNQVRQPGCDHWRHGSRNRKGGCDRHEEDVEETE